VTRKSVWVLALLALVALAVSSTALAKGKKSTGVVYAGITHQEGDNLIAAGDFKDSVLGSGAIIYTTKVSGGEAAGTVHIEAQKITIYTTKGSLTGKGAADQTFNDDGTSTISNGTFNLTKGTGKYKDHTFKGTFDGSQASDGIYTFNTEGTYK
jgi:hypothetical protein